jgi:orotidine-5'-phosphate decarboxylase
VPDDHVVILDAKRGDLSSTAERYAEGMLGHLAADGVTLSPYLGEDAVEPFRAYPDRLLYVLARTSNPSAPRFQDLELRGGATVSEHVAAWVAERWPVAEVGLVVGATAPDELAALRGAVPGPAFLVPGVGAQGGDLEAAVRSCHGTRAPGLVNISRGIAAASRGSDWRRAAAAAAESWRSRMAEASATLAL